MSRVVVRPFASEFIPAAAALLAARHRHDRSRLPFLAKAFEEAGECEGLLRSALAGQRSAGGQAAFWGQDLVGFLLAEKNLQPPTSLIARYVPPYSISIDLGSHAVAEGADASRVYALLYGAAAAAWVAGGFFEHRVAVAAGDAEVQEAWLNCGFGRQLTCAVRDTAPVGEANAADGGIEIHQAGAEDLEVVLGLEHTNDVHHWQAPISWPLLHETEAAARAHHRQLLEDPANAHFIAYRAGRPVGMDTFNEPQWLHPMLLGGRTVYLYQGVVEEDARGEGVGRQLLGRSMEWAREQGYDRCALHFASMNTSGGPFWLGQGFVPAEYGMGRHIDERVAWARP